VVDATGETIVEPTFASTVASCIHHVGEETRMWANAQRDGRPAEYRWCPQRKFCDFIACTTPKNLADGRCSSAVQQRG